MKKEMFKEILSSWSGRSREISLKHLVHKEIRVQDTILGFLKLFFMGEPLLHPEFDGLISCAQDAGVKVSIQTNGVLLKDRDVRLKLLASKPYEIGISIDGISKDTYEKVRVGAQWEDIRNGIMSFFQARKESGLADQVKVYITTILTDDYQKSRELALQFLDPVRPYVDGIVYTILNQSSKGSFFDLNGTMVSYEESPFLKRVSSASPVCEEALYKMNVLWDGAVVACCFDMEGAMKLGDCQEGIDNVWNAPVALGLRKALLNQALDGYQLCRSCKGIKH